MLLDADGKGDDFTLLGFGNGGMRAPVGQAGGEVPQQVDKARIAAICRPKELAQQLPVARADAFQPANIGKQRIEQSWPHAGFRGRSVRI